ncbi:hypothetical protein ATB97_04265 [Elizabethkingia bruuniana]|nr:hypothetical protein AYC65_19325 [Elizabethkingia bruuniana]KGO08161.1 hypothetical protein KS04_20235 [Elizabethkingia miricola]KUY26728.1 hypothetical protein ATB97_04265 [Elizabethkingia bruuniana]OPB66831.1 hypothetical protein BAY12_04885 [Elizabethkingia bruuniana]
MCNVTPSSACNEPVYSELDELNYRRVLAINFKQALNDYNKLQIRVFTLDNFIIYIGMMFIKEKKLHTK